MVKIPTLLNWTWKTCLQSRRRAGPNSQLQSPVIVDYDGGTKTQSNSRIQPSAKKIALRLGRVRTWFCHNWQLVFDETVTWKQLMRYRYRTYTRDQSKWVQPRISQDHVHNAACLGISRVLAFKWVNENNLYMQYGGYLNRKHIQITSLFILTEIDISKT